ncbi:ATP-grasp domain-containing protein [Salmonella enterica subsp. enterica]|nr:ATP-grasp domain-containing protein [Salmonella enterica subsp. enterica]
MHQDLGICGPCRVPRRTPNSRRRRIDAVSNYAALNYVGVMAMECFHHAGRPKLINELMPRVH